MEALKKYKTQSYFYLLLNIAFAVFITLASFVHLPLFEAKDYLFFFAQFVAIQFSVFGFLYVLSLNRYLFAIVFPLIFVVLAIVGYWVYTQDIAITQSVIQASLETKPSIAIELISFPFILYVLASLVVTFFLVKRHQKIAVNPWKSPLLILAFLGILCYPTIEHYKLGAFNRRLPFNVITATEDYFNKNNLILTPISTPIKAKADSLNVIFILGESVRADHMQLNGYRRATNPLLSKRKNIISFPNTYTPLTYTAVSVPQILTDATLTDDYSRPKYSLIDVLNRANIPTLWLGNQTPEKSYEVFIKQSKSHEIIDLFHSELSFKKAHDEALIPLFQKAFTPYRNQFTTLHMIGSHWWYETRYPDAFRLFQPVIKSKYIPSNSTLEMINSYDNTIVYLDYFLNKTIQQVEKYSSNTLIIYLSDHGELLGENNLWLHAQPGKESEHPAMLLWYSDTFEKKHHEWVSKLQLNKDKKINLDFFFPSILNLFKIEGIPYDKTKAL